MSNKYQITATTDEGDNWVFVTGDEERALKMYAQMKQDFEEVTMRQPDPRDMAE